MPGSQHQAHARALEALSQARLWSDAPLDSLRIAAERATLLEFAPGEVLIHQGRTGTHLHVVAAGRVDVRVQTDEGSAAVVASLEVGECIGEMSLLTGDPASADVVAATDVVSVALDAPTFRLTVAESPAALRRLVDILSERLRRTDEAVGNAFEKEHELAQLLGAPSDVDTTFVGSSTAARAVRAHIEELAANDAPFLVRGEDGTGKELVARLVHAQSSRARGLVISVDCADIADTEWGDRLFGPRGAPVGRGRGVSYLELARDGTVVLRDLEHLPVSVQDRLARHLAAHPAGHDVAQTARVVATSRGDPAEFAATGRIAPALLRAFDSHVASVPALRERKRDIPLLARHYLEKHTKRLERPLRELDDEALDKLVSYDYCIANQRELEEAMERAVILAERESVGAEEIFLGPPAPALPFGVDLLALPQRGIRRAVILAPRIGRVVGAAMFLALLAAAFLGPADPERNFATVTVWALGWPLLALSFFFVARAWCAICPMGLGASLVERVHTAHRRIPAWLKVHDTRIAMVGLFVILFVEETTHMRQSPLLTGWLLVTILAGAVGLAVLYPRRAWCRHVCPLGGMAGVCATSGLLEVRPTVDVCAARCTGHLCFKGDEHMPGCPMFNHVMFVSSNQDCVLCMRCVEVCPQDSPQLNLRLPGRELWTGSAASPQFGAFVILLSSLLVGMSGIQRLEVTGASVLGTSLVTQRFALAGAILTVCGAVAVGVTMLITRWVAAHDPLARARLWRAVAALAPLVTAGFVAYELGYTPLLPQATATVADAEGAAWFALPLLATLRLGVLTVGLFVTAFILRHHARETGEDRGGAGAGHPLHVLFGAVALCAVLLLLQIYA